MITLRNVCKNIQLKQGTLPILNDVSFSVIDDPITLLYGKSGSGKTTLLHIIAGLDSASSGTVNVQNKELSSLDFDQRAEFRLHHIGVVYQFFNLIPNLTLYENMTLPLTLAKRSIDHDFIQDVSKTLGITSVLTQYPTECSGGELQRASFGRAMMNRPELIVADEPTGNLDTENRERLLDLIQTLSKTYNTAFFIATHDDDFKRISNRVLHMVDGSLMPETVS